jgi:hypothetical protein
MASLHDSVNWNHEQQGGSSVVIAHVDMHVRLYSLGYFQNQVSDRMRMNAKFCLENIVQSSHLGHEEVTWRMYFGEVGQ